MRDGKLFRTYRKYRTAFRLAKKEEAMQGMIHITVAREEALNLNHILYEEFFRRREPLSRLEKLYEQGMKLKASVLSSVHSYQLNDLEVTS